MAKIKFSQSQFEDYTNKIVYASYLFNEYLIKKKLYYSNYQDYLNAFNDFLKSKDYQDSIKARKEL